MLTSTLALAFLKPRGQMFMTSTEILLVSFSMESFHKGRGSGLPVAGKAQAPAGSRAAMETGGLFWRIQCSGGLAHWPMCKERRERDGAHLLSRQMGRQ